MWRFFVEDLRRDGAFFLTSLAFLVTFLSGWCVFAPSQAAHVHGFFLWTMLVFLMQESCARALSKDKQDGTLCVLATSPALMGAYIFARFSAFLVQSFVFLSLGTLLMSLFGPSLNAETIFPWFMALPAVLALVFFATCVSLSQGPFLLGAILSFPLILPLLMLMHLSSTSAPAATILLACVFFLVPVCLFFSTRAIRSSYNAL